MQAQYEREPCVRKIAVLRANALGDFIVTLPALASLRAAYPTAEIVLLAKRWHAAFLDGRHGPVDRVIVIPAAPGVNVDPDAPADDMALDTFFAAMAHERFDLAVQVHGGGRYSNPFVKRLGAGLSIGLKTPDAMPLDRWVPYLFYQNEVVRFLEVMSLVGVEPVTLEPLLCVTPEDLAEAQRAIPDDGRPLIALHPGATDPRRRWPPEKFAIVGDALAAAGAHVVVTGLTAEREIVAAVIEGMRRPALDLCGRLSLGGLTGLLSRCHVVIANDSGPLHVAAAVGTSTVGIYWCSNLMTWAPLTRLRHRPLASWRTACPICGRDCIDDSCTHQASFVADVETEQVIAAALDLFTAAELYNLSSNAKPSETSLHVMSTPLSAGAGAAGG